jgi:Ca2+-binding RTX toxin-like protein
VYFVNVAAMGLVAAGIGLFGTVVDAHSQAVPDCFGKPATIVMAAPGTQRGTNGPEVIVGSDGDDFIYALGGNDVVCGGDGSDFIDGGTGSDEIFSDAGATESGSDVARGGTGNDFIIDHQARNDLDGGAGDDDVEGSGTVRGGSGNDTVVGSGEGTEVFGGSGDDFFLSDSAGQIFDGGSGRDQCATFGPDVFKSCEKIFAD